MAGYDSTSSFSSTTSSYRDKIDDDIGGVEDDINSDINLKQNNNNGNTGAFAWRDGFIYEPPEHLKSSWGLGKNNKNENSKNKKQKNKV